MATGKPEVLILSGPPGSGKTTAANLLVRMRDRAVHLESDSFFHFIASGYIDPWRTESHRQNEIVMAAVGKAAACYAHGGYFTVIEGIISPRWFFPPLRDALAEDGLRVMYAILRPSLAVSIQRAHARPSSRLSDAKVIEQLWREFDNLDSALESHVLDNSEQTPQETAEALAGQVARGALFV